jgi:glycosyltransferase involved in cell wall biosynthesis
MLKVSIITATHNSSATIKDTLLSIECQSYRNIEHLVIDGNSQDDTLAIVRSFRHVNHVLSEPDKGIYDAMNKGIRLATGDIIGILNSDDYYPDPDVIADVVDQFEATGCDTLYADLVYFSPQKNYKITRRWHSGNYNRKKFLMGWMPPHPTFFVKKTVYEKYGLFDTRFKSAADYELLVRLLYFKQVKTCYLERVIVHMRSGGQSNKNIINRLNAHIEDYRAWSYNQKRPRWYTIILKPLRKIWQYI